MNMNTHTQIFILLLACVFRLIVFGLAEISLCDSSGKKEGKIEADADKNTRIVEEVLWHWRNRIYFTT